MRQIFLLPLPYLSFVLVLADDYGPSTITGLSHLLGHRGRVEKQADIFERNIDIKPQRKRERFARMENMRQTNRDSAQGAWRLPRPQKFYSHPFSIASLVHERVATGACGPREGYNASAAANLAIARTGSETVTSGLRSNGHPSHHNHDCGS